MNKNRSKRYNKKLRRESNAEDKKAFFETHEAILNSTIPDIYNSMPKTKGCETCNKCFGEEKKDWCCKKYSIFMKLEEFRYLWTKVLEKKNEDAAWFEEVASRVAETFIHAKDNTDGHGCPFYNKGCTFYEHRPWTCRVFGVGGPTKECVHVRPIGVPMSETEYMIQHSRFQDRRCVEDNEDNTTPAWRRRFLKKALEGEYAITIYGWIAWAIDFQKHGVSFDQGVKEMEAQLAE